MNLSIFSVFLKIETFFSKIRISKFTDYAALKYKCMNFHQYVPAFQQFAYNNEHY